MTDFKRIIFFTFFVLFSLSLLAETTFPTPPTTIDETHQHMLYDYKLPTWSYDKAKVSLNFLNDYDDQDNKEENSDNYEQQSSSIDLNLLPAYTYYYESENKILNIASETNLEYEYDSEEFEHYDYEGNAHILVITPKVETNFSNYLFTNLSINNRSEFSYKYYNYKSDYERNEKDSQTNRKEKIIDLICAISAGYGRIRNVTPVINSLRFNERYKAISNSSGFDEVTLGKLANHFATKTSYSQYERSEKYFYKELPEEVRMKLKQLDSGDLFYILDYLREANSDRYQGYKVEFGAKIIHSNDYYKEELVDSLEQITYNNERRNEKSLLSPFISGRISHNINLYHQIGGKAEISYGKYINDNTFLRENFHTDMSLDYLWVMYDRLSFNSQMTIGFDKVLSENNTKKGKYAKWYNKFSYKLIDKISLNPVLYLYIYNADETNRELSTETIRYKLSFSVDYMF